MSQSLKTKERPLRSNHALPILLRYWWQRTGTSPRTCWRPRGKATRTRTRIFPTTIHGAEEKGPCPESLARSTASHKKARNNLQAGDSSGGRTQAYRHNSPASDTRMSPNKTLRIQSSIGLQYGLYPIAPGPAPRRTRTKRSGETLYDNCWGCYFGTDSNSLLPIDDI